MFFCEFFFGGRETKKLRRILLYVLSFCFYRLQLVVVFKLSCLPDWLVATWLVAFLKQVCQFVSSCVCMCVPVFGSFVRLF